MATDEELREVCERLAYAHDALIQIARGIHVTDKHGAVKWTECDAWPCYRVGRIITGKIDVATS